MKKLVWIAIASMALAVSAADYTWTGAAGNGLWQDRQNFTVEGDVPESAPGSADIVTVPDSMTITLEYDVNDAAKKLSCETFAGVQRIIPGGKGTVFDITVPEGNTPLVVSCVIANLKTTDSSKTYGTLIKNGAGELDLTAQGVYASSDTYYDYAIDFDVRAGVLKMPQGANDAYAIQYGKMKVAEGATLFMPHNTKSLKKAYFETLTGNGTLTNDCSYSCELAVRRSCEFAGRLTGAIYVFTPGGTLFLTGTGSTVRASNVTTSNNYGNGAGRSGYGAVGIMKFGHKKTAEGVQEPSSIGFVENLVTRDNGGAFLYLGEGEETDKDLKIWQSSTSYPTYLDAGAYGGLVWNGSLAPYTSGYSTFDYYMSRLILTGSNTTDCVVNGKILNYSKSGVGYPMCVTKEGTGTWRINYNSASTMHSVWQVKNGTLAFDTIARVGVNSALGYSNWLYRDLAGSTPKDEDKVDYAFLLGNGVGKTRGNLDYVGTTNCVSSGRLFAVNGTGALRNNGTGRLDVSDFAVKTGVADSTLVLGGSNTADNVVDNLQDGDSGKLSVVKEDAGTWRLGTNCAFTGSLDVKAGRAIVGMPLYGYYRWVLRATFYTSTSKTQYRYVGLRHFGLYDADGNLRTDQMDHTGDWYETKEGSSTCYTSYPYSYRKPYFGDAETKELNLGEGHFRATHYGSSDIVQLAFADRQGFTNLFCRAGGWGTTNMWNRNPQSQPIYAATNTWIVFTVHPRPGKPIVGWDFVNDYYASGYSGGMISNATLEASVDGVTWAQIDEVTNDKLPKKGAWQSNGETYDPTYVTHTGRAIPSGPVASDSSFSASSVSVAPGAELIAQGAEVPVPQITVDANGMGALRGFALDEGGVIDIANAPEKGAFSVAVDFSGVTLPTDYAFTINGKPSHRIATLSADGTRIDVVPSGMLILVR